MLGHRLDDIYPPRRSLPPGDTVLEISGLHDDRLLQDIALTLRRGEVLGIAGLAGAGKSELCKALFGATRSRVASGRLHGAPGGRAARTTPSRAEWRWCRRSGGARDLY